MFLDQGRVMSKGNKKSNHGWLFYLFVVVSFFSTSFYVSAAEDNLYDFLWLDPDKSVYVLQNRTYRKKNKFFIELDGLKVVGDEFLNAYGVSGKAGYFLSEEWGVSLNYTSYINSFNDNFKNLSSSNIEPFLRQFQSIIAASVLYTPFYGKVNTYNSIIYFDWGFHAGLASIKAESNLLTASDLVAGVSFLDESYIGLIYGTDFKIHLNSSFYINLELRAISYSAESTPSNKSKKTLQTHTDFLFGVGFSI